MDSRRDSPPILTLLTDFGTRDYYVAAVRGTILRLAPGAHIVDLSHDIEPGDLEAAAFLLAAAAPAFPPRTLHLAVVDPGVGSARRMLCLETSEATFLAPDNGLLGTLLGIPDSILRVIDRPDLYLEPPGATFHGRDRFAPIAAALLRGLAAAELGPLCLDPVRQDIPAPERRDREILGRVAHVDRFGNLITDVPMDWLGGAPWEARVGSHQARRRVTHYAELSAGEVGLLAGSLGTLELALAGESLATRWAVRRGERVRLSSS
ncbi:MAG: SAM-dependent chlorinase/fluorinase [Acidobacteriota bacterium]